MELKKVGLKFFNVLIIGLILCSCTQLRYTDYGRPFDFLKAKKFKSNPVLIELEQDKKVMAQSSKSNSADLPITQSKKVNQELAQADDLSSKKLNLTASNAVSASNPNASFSMLRKTKEDLFYIHHIKSPNAVVLHNSFETPSSSDQADDIILMLLCILLPPLAVFMAFGLGDQFWIDLLLTLIFFLPGVIYAIYVCFLK